jgi:hypothetical protein
VKVHAQYFEADAKYKRGIELGKGKFSTVYLAQKQEMTPGDQEEDLAMKFIDKKSLSRKERDFLRDEI